MQSSIDHSTKSILPLILATAIFMQMLDATILNTSLKAIAQDLNESPLDMQNVIVSYVLTVAIFMPVSGYLSDKFGTRTVFVSSLFLFSLGSLFCAMAQELYHLVLARIVQGFGGAMMTPVGRLVLIKAYGKNELLKAMNYALIPALIGPVLGPLVGGYFVDYFSWHWIFIVNIPIGVLGMVFGWFFMPNLKSDSYWFDRSGFFVFSMGSLLLSWALELLANTPRWEFGILVFVFGICCFCYYYYHAGRVSRPIFPLELFEIRTFRVGIWGNFLTRLGISAIPLLVPLMIQMAYGKSAIISGWIVAPMAVMAMFGKTKVVKILNTFGYRKTLKANSMFLGICIMALAIPGKEASVYYFLPIIVMMGFFNSIQFTSMNTIAIANLRVQYASSGNTLLAVNQQLAIGFGVALGLLLLKFTEVTIAQKQVHTAFRYTFIILGILTALMGNIFSKLHPSDGRNLKS